MFAWGLGRQTSVERLCEIVDEQRWSQLLFVKGAKRRMHVTQPFVFSEWSFHLPSLIEKSSWPRGPRFERVITKLNSQLSLFLLDLL